MAVPRGRLPTEYAAGVEVAERIRERGAELTAAERRIAEVVLEAPQSIGFGTVADLAKAAQVGAASVVRLATKLGFDGYSELQQAVQAELMQQLRPAVERIQVAESGPAPITWPPNSRTSSARCRPSTTRHSRRWSSGSPISIEP